MMFYQLLWGQAVQVAKPGLHHDREMTEGLLDDAFRNAVDGPADICLR